MNRNVKKEANKAKPTAIATTTPATVPFARLWFEEFCGLAVGFFWIVVLAAVVVELVGDVEDLVFDDDVGVGGNVALFAGLPRILGANRVVKGTAPAGASGETGIILVENTSVAIGVP